MHQVQVSGTAAEPPDRLLIMGAVDAWPVATWVLRAEYDAQPTIAARRHFVAVALATVFDAQMQATEPGLQGVVTVQ